MNLPRPSVVVAPRSRPERTNGLSLKPPSTSPLQAQSAFMSVGVASKDDVPTTFRVDDVQAEVILER